MNINSIKKNDSSAAFRERLKRRDMNVYDPYAAGSSVKSKEDCEDKSGRVMRDYNSAAFSFGRKGLLGSERIGRVLYYMDEHNQTINAGIGLVMGGIIRPGLTSMLNLKEKKDKFLAIFHSIASAVLGFAVTMGITQPIDDAITKATKKPELYGNEKYNELKKRIDELTRDGKRKNLAEIKELKKQQDAMKLISRNIPEWIICVPRAMLTVALVPVFMRLLAPLFEKHETKKDAKKAAKNSVTFEQNPKSQNANQKVNFKGKLSAYDKLTDWIAKKVIAPFMNTELMKKKTMDWRNSEFLYDGMATVSSLAISSTYAIRSYKNKKIDEDKKNRAILALNHILTWAISTTISLLTVKKLGIWWQRHPMAKLIEKRMNIEGFAKKYIQKHQEILNSAKKIANKKERKIALRDARNYSAQDYFEEFVNEAGFKDDTPKMLSGLKLFQKQLVWGTVTRLLVPLASTIIASKLGRKAIDKREAKKEAALQAEFAQQQMTFGEQEKIAA